MRNRRGGSGSVVNILLVEDEAKIRNVLTAYLRKEGWNVDCTADGCEAVRLYDYVKHDLVVLDLMIEGMSGEDVCRKLRERSSVPIVMLTSKDRENDKIEGLRLGADDYITKPFSAKEVVARVHALLRRAYVFDKAQSAGTPWSFDNGRIVIRPEYGTVAVNGKPVALTSTEFKLLAVLAGSPGMLFSRSDLTYQVLGHRFHGDSRAIDMHVKNVRKKVEPNSKAPVYIVTVVGGGYRFAPVADRPL